MNKLTILCIIVLTTVLLVIAPSCAKAIFEPSNLTISPQEVKVGQSATISVDITNTGGAEGSYPVILKINGMQIDDQTVTVAPGATQQTRFTVAKEEAGSYTVDVNGLTATLKVLKPAEFKTEALIISPTEVFRGSSSKVTVDVTNIGEVEGDYEVTLRVTDKVAQTKKVTLAGGATETVSFYLSEDETGTYTLSVNGLSGTLTVTLKPAEFKMRKLVVSPEEVPPGSSCKVTIEVTNIGDIQGDCEVTLRVNDENVETKKVTLAAGATETVSFYLSEDEAGTYDLSVNGLSGTLTVTEGVLPTLHIGDQWVYRMVLDGPTTHTVTQTITGEEKIDGRDCYVVRLTFDPPLEGLIPTWTDWWEKRTLDRIQWQFSTTSNGVTGSSTQSYSYSFITTSLEEASKGDTRWPREVGNEWTQEVTIKTVNVIAGETTTSEMKVTEQYEVEAMEIVTTPAGKFECFRIVVYDVSVVKGEGEFYTFDADEQFITYKKMSYGTIQRGQVKEEIWYSDKVKARVKYESAIGESWELLSYSVK